MRILTIILTFLVASCTSLYRQQTGDYQIYGKPDVVADRVYELAEKCWQTPIIEEPPEIVLKKTAVDGMYNISAQSKWPDEEELDNPFIEVIIGPGITGTQVIVFEGGVVNPLGDVSRVTEVNGWLYGGSSCLIIEELEEE